MRGTQVTVWNKRVVNLIFDGAAANGHTDTGGKTGQGIQVLNLVANFIPEPGGKFGVGTENRVFSTQRNFHVIVNRNQSIHRQGAAGIRVNKILGHIPTPALKLMGMSWSLVSQGSVRPNRSGIRCRGSGTCRPIPPLRTPRFRARSAQVYPARKYLRPASNTRSNEEQDKSMFDFNFGLGDDIDMLRESVSDFAADRIAPRAEEIDSSNQFPRDLWPESVRWDCSA